MGGWRRGRGGVEGERKGGVEEGRGMGGVEEGNGRGGGGEEGRKGYERQTQMIKSLLCVCTSISLLPTCWL